MTQLFTNNATSELNGAIDAVTTSITLKTGDGAKFPTPTGGNFFLVTLFNKVNALEVNHEIMKCTARATDVLTVVRAQEGTTARAFSSTTALELRLTAATLSAKQDTADRDISGGIPGLTLFKLNLRNAANTITSWFTNAATAARTWTLPDKDGTVAMTSDLPTLASLGAQAAGTYATGGGTATGTNTGDQTTVTGSAGSVVNAVTFDTTGGAAAGTTFNGSAIRTVDYSTVGAAAAGHTHSYQAADADLLAIGGLTGTSGYLKKTAADTWTLDTSTFATGGGTATGSNTGDNSANTLYSGLAASKQDALVSGTSIKTVGGVSLLGAGDIALSVDANTLALIYGASL